MHVLKLIDEAEVQVHGRFEFLNPPDTKELAKVARNLSDDLPDGWRWQGKTTKWQKHQIPSDEANGYCVYSRIAIHATVGEVALICRRRERNY